MEIVEEILKELTRRKNNSLELAKTYPDKSKRGKFRDYAGAYVDAIVAIEEIRDERNN